MADFFLAIFLLFPLLFAFYAFVDGVIKLFKIEKETKDYIKKHYKATKLE